MNVLKFKLGMGVALCLTGVPIGMYMNYMFRNVGWSPIIMACSVLLIVNYRRLLSGRFVKPNRLILAVLLFQLLMLTYGIFSSGMTWQYATFHIYVITLIGALCTNPKDPVRFDQALLWTFALSGACSILGAVLVWKGMIVGQQAWELRQENEYYALEIFTASYAALVCIASALYLPYDRYKRTKWAAYPVSIAAAYVVIFGEKRTPLVVLLVIVLVYLAKHKRIKAPVLLKYAVIGLAAFAALYMGNHSFQAQINESVVNTVIGIANILGDTSTLDNSGSAIARYDLRSFAYSYIDKNFSLGNYLLGGGYMVKWLDNPLLQSYLDMGILGFIGYLAIVVVYPITILSSRNSDNTVLFLASMSTYAVLSSINSGNPYQYIKYTPVVLLAFFVTQSRVGERVRLGLGARDPHLLFAAASRLDWACVRRDQLAKQPSEKLP